ncbi:MAG: cohesin domain-containing protein, partial [Promethearchaeota archaeon]
KDTTTFYRNENPSIAYGDGKFFVAWEHYNTVANPDPSTMDIKARTVQRSGSNLQLGSFIDVSSAPSCQADANVEYDSINNRFCVVWEDARLGGSPTNYNIYGKLFTSSGTQIGSEKTICSTTNSESEPWVAFDHINEKYMIVWEEGDHPEEGPFDIKMGIFDSDLNLIGNINIVAEGNADTDYNYPCVEFCSETQRYLVTWNEGDISDDDWWGFVWGKIYDSSGSVVFDTFQISGGENIRTDIVTYLNNAFLVSYDDDTAEKIRGKLITSNGEILTNEIQLSDDFSLADWSNMAVGDDKVLIVWEDIREDYPFPWNSMPDVFGNIRYLDFPDGSEVSYSFGDEQELVLTAFVTSIAIDLPDLALWDEFNVDFSGTISFDILDGITGGVILNDVYDDQSISDITASSIRLMASFSRLDSSSTPTLDIWSISWIQNHLPNIPTNPSPVNNATEVEVNADISWTGGDPDTGDTVIYDVYFGTICPPSLVESDLSDTNYDPGTMQYNTTHYWQIVATDNHDASVTGPIWNFKTEEKSADTIPPEISNVDIVFSGPMDTDPLFGWESFTCDVSDAGSGVDEVYLYLTYPDSSESNFLMSNTGGSTYTYNTTLSDVGDYGYYIYAVDNLGNDDNSSVDSFTIYPNWDIDMNSHIYLPDLVQVSLSYEQSGANGWIREDVDNNGQVFLPDLVQVSLHYDETWLLSPSLGSSFKKDMSIINADTTYLKTIPSSQTVLRGKSFSVEISVEPGEPINGVAFAMSFDPSLIHADEVTEGDLFDGFSTFFNPGTIDNLAGTISSVYGLTVPATNTVTDPGTFCTISFTAQNIIGTSALDLFDICVTDLSGECVNDIIVDDGIVKLKSFKSLQLRSFIIADDSSISKNTLNSNLGTTYVSISPSSQIVGPGNTFTVDVYIEPGEPINGVALAFSFDESYIQAEEVTEGDLFEDYTTFFNPGTIDNGVGTITSVYGFTVPATNTVTTPGTFCTISFTAQSTSGTSNLHLYDMCITDISGECITTIIIYNGTVQIDADPPNTVLNALNEYYTSPPSISGTATDQSYGGIEKIEMKIQRDSDNYYWSGSNWQIANTWFDAATGLSGWNNVPWTASSLPSWQSEVTYDLEARANDNGGNIDPSPASDSFTYDISAPTINNVDIVFSGPMDTDPLFGWESFTCDVSDAGSGVDEVYLYLTYPDSSESNFLMSNTGGSTYTYNTTLSDVGDYGYYIYAVDNLGNDDNSSVDSFTIYPNWDIDMNSHIYLPDLVQVSLSYEQSGANGWIREDVDNNGQVFLPDLVQVSLHYDETWLLSPSLGSSFKKDMSIINADTTYLKTIPSSQTVLRGKSFSVEISVEPGEPINGVAFAMSFDPSLIHADEVTEGDLFDGFSTFFNPGTIDNLAGTISSVYGLTVPATNTVTDPGTFCTISFTAQNIIGTSALDLFDICVTDLSGECITDTVIDDGSVTVIDNGVNNPPIFSNENPDDDATDIPITTSSLTIYISDPDGDSFDWSIETSPDIGSNNDSSALDGTKNCDISGLSSGTTYTWIVTAEDPSGSKQTVTEEFTFTTETSSNSAPNKPTISGPPSGKKGYSYSYTATTTDPDNDQISYWFDWDDGTNSGWVGPYNSGQTAVKSHIWSQQGSYSIKVKAKDSSGKESVWSDPSPINMPKTKNRPFLNFLENHPILYKILQRVLKLPIFEKLLIL